MLNYFANLFAIFAVSIITATTAFLPSAAAAPRESPAGGASNRLTVLRFTGPDDLKTHDDLGFKLRTGQQKPTETDFADLADAFQRTLGDKLKTRIGTKSVVPYEDLQRALSGSNIIRPSDDNARRYSQIARATRARYLVTGNIDLVEFSGATVIDDVYAMTVSARLISGDTGEVIWRMPAKRFEKKLSTQKGQKVMSIFFDSQVPEISNYISSQLVGALGSR